MICGPLRVVIVSVSPVPWTCEALISLPFRSRAIAVAAGISFGVAGSAKRTKTVFSRRTLSAGSANRISVPVIRSSVPPFVVPSLVSTWSPFASAGSARPAGSAPFHGRMRTRPSVKVTSDIEACGVMLNIAPHLPRSSGFTRESFQSARFTPLM